jgi:hypothetical protein
MSPTPNPKHANGVPACPLCELKLAEAHPDLAAWFRDSVKPANPAAHVSWSFRGKEDQEKAFLDNKSKLPFPLSAHNKSDDQGNPCALAIDLFELDYNGMACWPWAFFRKIADAAKAAGVPIRWGGDFKNLGDADHMEWRLTAGHTA